MTTAILLIAHGSRRPQANSDLVKLAEMIRERERFEIVEIAYLELTTPSIPDGLARCVERGATEIRMLPYFLSAGVHIAEDLTAAQSEFLAAHDSINCTLCPPLGLHDGVVDVLLSRADEEFTPPQG